MFEGAQFDAVHVQASGFAPLSPHFLPQNRTDKLI